MNLTERVMVLRRVDEQSPDVTRSIQRKSPEREGAEGRNGVQRIYLSVTRGRKAQAGYVRILASEQVGPSRRPGSQSGSPGLARHSPAGSRRSIQKGNPRVRWPLFDHARLDGAAYPEGCPAWCRVFICTECRQRNSRTDISVLPVLYLYGN